MDVAHTAIWVSDLDEARDFFVEDLGLAEQRSHTRNGIENIFVGGEGGSIQLRTEPRRRVPSGDRTRMDHLALSVDDVDAICSRLSETTDYEVFRPPETLDELPVRIAFVEGPDGYAIELVEALE